jgi:hypothetical protein
LIFPAPNASFQKSAVPMIARRTSARSPLLLVKASAPRATTASEGASETKRRQSFVAMKRAVEGWRARRSRTSSPSFLPWLAGRRWPRTVLAPWSWVAARNANPPARWSIPQPVKARATSCTSAWV